MGVSVGNGRVVVGRGVCVGGGSVAVGRNVGTVVRDGGGVAEGGTAVDTGEGAALKLAGVNSRDTSAESSVGSGVEVGCDDRADSSCCESGNEAMAVSMRAFAGARISTPLPVA